MPSFLASLGAALGSFVAWIAHKWDAIIYSGFPIIFWVKPRWDVSQIPDQTGKVVIVTGGNSGTGYITSRSLFHAGAKVYLACRNESKALDAIERIKAARKPKAKPKPGSKTEYGVGELVYLNLDLMDLESVDRFADEFLSKENRLDILFANAGIMATQEGLYTKQGYTIQFGTNVLGHHRLITRLLPVLRATSDAHPEDPARVITLSSAGHSAAPSGGVDYRSVVREAGAVTDSGNQPRRGKYERMRWVEYGQSKWGDIALAKYLDWTYGPRTTAKQSGGEIIAISLHPGMVATNLFGHLPAAGLVQKYAPFILRILTRPPEDGAGNQLWAATCPVPQARELSGKYIVPFQQVGRPRADVEDRGRVEKMWNWCDEQARKHL
ncbi:hypothetical protein EHS25_002539 [Saitozyma podzolica]|uniref:Pod-specific dehydrogenase n=1 Tax=Saitozyma podzolica TaxID=1890683 RepID=A0A427YD41_9TREE|nr:hypothetical protein EHS25_002539 [Saitozyma podzolica]